MNDLPTSTFALPFERPHSNTSEPSSILSMPTTITEVMQDDALQVCIDLAERSRRHSLGLMRKPVRSSPLARPSLCDDVVEVDEAAMAPFPSPTRTASSPNLRSLTTQSDSTLKKNLSRRASIFDLVRRPRKSSALPAPKKNERVVGIKSEPGYKAKPPARLDLGLAHSGMKLDLPLPPPLSPRRRSRARSRSEMTSANMPVIVKTPDLAAFPLPPPNYPVARTQASSNQRHSLSRSNSSSRTSLLSALGPDRVDNDTGDSWLTSLPFGDPDTPRFSRLGLSASTVVLPVPAKAAKRKSLRGEGGKRISLAPPTEDIKSQTPPPFSQQLHIITNGTMSIVSTAVPPRASSLQNSPSGTIASVSTPSLRSSRSPSLSSDGPSTPDAVWSRSVVGVETSGDDPTVVSRESLDLDLLSELVGREFAMRSPCPFILTQDAESDDGHGIRGMSSEKSKLVNENLATLTPAPAAHDRSTSGIVKDTASVNSNSRASTGNMWLSRPVSDTASLRHRRSSANSQQGTSFLWFGSGDSTFGAESQEEEQPKDVALTVRDHARRRSRSLSTLALDPGLDSPGKRDTSWVPRSKASKLLGMDEPFVPDAATPHYSKKSALQDADIPEGKTGSSSLRRLLRSIGLARKPQYPNSDFAAFTHQADI
ncbi:hypothetical protein MIND_00371700 [Mycena indigotica]|uniref:Uncharacterized protein n=1 Tax=Mycena indigotica TaxID=2126181 RepID=A0A8H6W8U6_9AGAR|nr:uncharacterized protein MIND_00371700 [Mycena indigotica]KAF7309989.1 hypothetical protein MIND_00371700 [Mycena indigotica]